MYTKRQPKPQAAISEAIVPTFVAISVLGTNINSKIFWDHTLGVRSIFFFFYLSKLKGKQIIAHGLYLV